MQTTTHEKLLQRFQEIGDIEILNRFLHYAKEMIQYAKLEKEKYLVCAVLDGQKTLRVILGNRVVLGLEKKENGFEIEYFAEKNENFYQSAKDTIKSFSKESSKGVPFVLVYAKNFESFETNQENFLNAIKKAKETSFPHKEYKHNPEFFSAIMDLEFRKTILVNVNKNSNMFDIYTWVKPFQELAKELLKYKNRQNELIQIVKDLEITGLEDKDENENSFLMQEIDAFTFIALLNKFGNQRRINLINLALKHLNLPYAIKDVEGLPTAQAQRVWFFPYKKDRTVQDINWLWDFFEKAVNNQIDEVIFSKILNIKFTGKAKLTQALFWVNSEWFLPLDSNTIPFLEKQGIETDFANWNEYQAILENVKNRIGKPFYEISHLAYLDTRKSEPINEVAYYLFGAFWNQTEDKTEHFLEMGIWENGYDDKYQEDVKKVEIGAWVAIKASFVRNKQSVLLIKAIGQVIDNQKDGKKIFIDWKKDFVPFEINDDPSVGQYRATFKKLINTNHIERIFFGKQEFFQNTSPKPRLSFPKNQILYGAPGTGKTYSTIVHSLAILENIAVQNLKNTDRTDLKSRFEEWAKQGRVEFVTFHQNFSYEDFVEGFKPQTLNKEQQMGFRIESGILKRLADKAQANPDQNYVLIIDEINRGNVSQIFGELITLLEDDKRLGEKEEIRVQLPYSKMAFGVPSNLYLLGTMNTADRSVEALDTALRRRFSFVEMPSDPSVLVQTKLADADLDLVKLLATINARLEILLSRDQTIGHAYLLDIQDFSGLKTIFQNKIIPLLQEYFYQDFGKVGLVLGNHFVHLVSSRTKLFDLKDYDKDTIYDLTERKRYEITDPQTWTVEGFREVYA